MHLSSAKRLAPRKTLRPAGIAPYPVEPLEARTLLNGSAQLDPAFSFEGQEFPAAVVGRHVFYNNSAFDGRNPGPTFADDDAIATDKSALLPGGTATFANLTSYSRGINGVMIDLANLVVTPQLEDFLFRAGTDANPAGWGAVTPPTNYTRRPGGGMNGSDRITFTWPDGAITNKWLQVTVKPSGRVPVEFADVFYFGNMVGETGNLAGATIADVTWRDVVAARNDFFDRGVSTTHVSDINRDGRVNAVDIALIRRNLAGTALRLLAPPVAGVWETGPAMPISLGEVAGGIIGGNIYLVGEGNAATVAYDLMNRQWRSAGLAQRPFAGNHHTAEVIGGKLYLFGGLGSSSAGKVQIYDPLANTWTQGAVMPFAAGSSSSALIGGKVYVAGGIIGSSTTNRLARYDPATNTWMELATMPQGRNHAAGATDGTKLYVFGGRGPGSGDGNMVANGFNTVQVYDPASNTWQSSANAGSTLRPLPQARGGMGRAVFANGELYVIGGETLTGAGATPQNVYNRVDVYNPATNTWRLDAQLPTARHGIFPILHAGRIYVAGGGVQAGASRSTILEILNVLDR